MYKQSAQYKMFLFHEREVAGVNEHPSEFLESFTKGGLPSLQSDALSIVKPPYLYTLETGIENALDVFCF